MKELEPLIQVGAVGAVLFWFLLKLLPRLDRLIEEIQEMRHDILLLTLTHAEERSPHHRMAEERLADIVPKPRPRRQAGGGGTSAT